MELEYLWWRSFFISFLMTVIVMGEEGVPIGERVVLRQIRGTGQGGSSSGTAAICSVDPNR